MSYAFDVLAKAWVQLEEKLPPNVRGSELCARFGFMLEELHECDHRLRGQINQDSMVSKKARTLDQCINKGDSHD